jgi:hypothetical protein
LICQGSAAEVHSLRPRRSLQASLGWPEQETAVLSHVIDDPVIGLSASVLNIAGHLRNAAVHRAYWLILTRFTNFFDMSLNGHERSWQ